MKQVNDLGQAPAADFAVFGLFGNDTWSSCFKPYRTAVLMHDIAETESLDTYAEHIKSLDRQWNGKYCFLVTMADFRMRSEHFERMRRRLELQFTELQEAHPGVRTSTSPERRFQGCPQRDGLLGPRSQGQGP